VNDILPTDPGIGPTPEMLTILKLEKGEQTYAERN
jgi:hypothetical protein